MQCRHPSGQGGRPEGHPQGKAQPRPICFAPCQSFLFRRGKHPTARSGRALPAAHRKGVSLAPARECTVDPLGLKAVEREARKVFPLFRPFLKTKDPVALRIRFLRLYERAESTQGAQRSDELCPLHCKGKSGDAQHDPLVFRGDGFGSRGSEGHFFFGEGLVERIVSGCFQWLFTDSSTRWGKLKRPYTIR